MKELNIQKLIQLELSRLGCIAWRNETFKAYSGRVIHKQADQVTLSGSIMLAGGLCVGSSDLIGITPDGLFLAIEVKTKTGRIRPEQTTFINAVRKAGGRAGIARCVEDVAPIVNGVYDS